MARPALRSQAANPCFWERRALRAFVCFFAKEVCVMALGLTYHSLWHAA
jgi:hypothetical protein